MGTAQTASSFESGLTAHRTPYKTSCAIGTILQKAQAQWRSLIQSPNVSFTCFITPELHDIELENPMPLQQGLAALLANAQQLTRTGRVHIHATLNPASGPEQRPAITIIIADTGTGIAPATLNAFFQNKRPLAPLRVWARENKGDLTLISNLGRGSEFTLTFSPPAHRAKMGDKATLEDNMTDQTMGRYIPIDLGLDLSLIHI